MPERVDARKRVLRSAEQLIAEQGTAVSLREVAQHAGQRNNSAVHYYFGTRDALIRAIVDEHQPALEQARLVLLAQDQPDDVPELVRTLVTPMFTVPYAAGSTHYARCLEKVRDHPAVSREPVTTEWPATKVIVEKLDEQLAHLPGRVRVARLHSLTTVMFGLLADLERTNPRHRDEAEQDVLDMIAGLLLAPTGVTDGSPRVRAGS